ncbi:hypothetical protein QAD02_001963 [Eretmocerus hayati]|uniref:Uncharacterized protein n=1 Tax=Eretmocerus hayati TaxID=131215 RepID=A0ACC2NHI8_9HYME|nr:hypothetical protein QAD02_001963 [Eretmocerus hayati]
MDDVDVNVLQIENMEYLFDMEVDGDQEELDGDDDDIRNGRVPKRYLRDFQNPFEHWNENQFTSRYRFSKGVVMYYILPLVRHELDLANSRRGLPVSPEIQLTLGLRYYATNMFQKANGDIHGLSQSTVCLCVRRVSLALAGLFTQFVQLPTDEEQMLNTQLFYTIAGMKGIYALIDGVLIKIASPGSAIAELFRCRKGYFALNVLAIVDAKGSFRYMDVRHPGSVHDMTALDRSALKMLFERGFLKGISLGDPGYACKRYLFTPFVQASNEAEQAFNDSLIATRSFIERIFGRWKKKFPCLRLGLSTKLDTSIATICATAVLWNIHVNLNYSSRLDLENLDIQPEAFAEPPRAGLSGLEYRREYVMRYFT